MKKRSLLMTLLSLILTFSVSIGLTTTKAYAEEAPVEYSMGDANLDGNVNTRDVVLIKQSIVGLTELNDKQKVFADVYADGQINTRDVVLIQQSIVGMGVDLGTHEHSFENGVCICGYVEPHTHNYSELKFDVDSHWYECSCGAYETKENHIPGAEATETTDQKCTECNYVITPTLGHVHTLHLTKVYAKQQSCTATGNVEYYTCSCGKWFTDNTATTEITDKTSVVIKKDAHEYETLKKTATEHWWECSCGAYETKENHIPGAEATETTDQKCTECNYVIAPALGHVHTLHLIKVYAKQQSCTATGNIEYYTCSCGKWFTDNTATTEITDEDIVVIEKDDHKYETLKKTATEHWWECSCGDKDGLEEHHGGNATCTQKAVCTDCGLEYGSLEKHNYTELKKSETQHWYECSCGVYETKENHKGGTATCQVKATCSICDTIYGDFAEHEPKTAWVITDTHHYHECSYGCNEKLNYSEHSFTNYVSNKDATYESDGTKTATCDGGCGKTHTVTDVGSMLIKDEIRFTTLTVNDKNVYGKVSNATTEFVFYEEIVVSGNATYVVDNDKDCSSPIDSKTVDLVVGDNAFYVLEKVGNNVKLYTVTIHRRAMFTVTFNTNGGTAVDNQTIEEDSFATAPTTSKTGYTFGGWDYDFNTAITKDTVINAKWSINQYTITIVYNNGQDDLVLTQDYNSDIATVSNPTKTGYSFTGWDKTIPSKMPAEDVMINATWKINQYTIIIVYNNGQENLVIKQDYNTDVETIANPEKTGYTFAGWDKTIPSKMPAENVTIRASWDVIVYDIVYNLNGGKLTTVKNKYTIEQAVTFDNPTRDYYTFSGWYYNADFSGSNVDGIAVGSYGDIELYAKWTPINYDITYVLNGGTNDKNNPTKYNVETSTITLNNPTRDGYTFDGWYLEKTFNTEVTQIEQGSHGDINLYAKWIAIFTLSGGEITGLTDHGITLAKLIVPEKIDGVEISSIGEEAFSGCESLTSVTIGNSVTSIGYEAFRSCRSLTNITIPDSVKSIGSYAFEYCTNLQYNEKEGLKYLGNEGNKYLYLAYGVSKYITTANIDSNCRFIGEYAFYGSSSLTSVVIGDSVTSIGRSAFEGCKSLTRVVIGESVTSIGAWAFENCSSLTSVEIPNSVISIGNYTFSGCSSLTSIVIPDSVTQIGSASFSGCSSLTKITLPFIGASLSGAHFGYIFGASSYEYNKYYVPLSLRSVTITGGNILYAAFYNCYSLTNVIIGNNVTSIGDYAFRDCESLTSVTIENSATSISDYAFYGCPITNATMPAVAIAFIPKTNLKTLVVNCGKGIGDNAFEGCTSLTSIVIGDSVTSISASAFYSCDSLTSITVDKSNVNLKDIDGNLYSKDGKTLIRYATGKTDALFTIPSCVTSIGDNAFSGCDSLTSVVIGDSVTIIGNYAFFGCDSLESIEIPNSVTSIGNYAFRDCDSLISVVIGDSVRSIGYYAFYNCSSLTSVVIGDSVTSIGSYSFEGCPIEKATMPTAAISSINKGKLKEVIITGGTSVGDYAFRDCDSLISVVIGDSVTSIGDEAFYDCDLLTSVTIGNSVTRIGRSAFEGCNSLTSIVIGNRVISIGYEAFAYCSSLTSVTIPDSVKSIGDYAFRYCSSLTSVTIGGSVTSIGDYAFHNCDSLKKVNYTGTIDQWVQIEFGAIDSNPLYYAEELYINNELVTEANITTATKINDDAFYNCRSLTSVTIGNSVARIGNSAFEDCDSLISVVIGRVTSIGSYSFDGCTSFKTVYYKGTSGDWKNISISSNNSLLKNTMIYYNYDGKNHTYKFDVNGGQEVVDITSNLAITLPTPTKENWYFGGWYDNAEFTGTAYFTTYYNSFNTTLYAKWLTESEYNEYFSSFALAISVTSGERITANIDTAGEKIYYKFVPTESKSYTIKSSGGLDTYGYLYDSNFSQITYNDGTADFTITRLLTAGETYYIVVKMYSSSATGTFTVSIT